ncbi:MAG: histone deacetylase family protein, partial [Hyphomicrobiales bacterium]|nr:histone deacetylase family protein [Hyphomicrobiales bacterium]
MKTIVLTHDLCAEHIVPRGHPERPARIQAVLKAFEDDALKGIPHRTAPRALLEDIERVHSKEMVADIMERIPSEGIESLDADTCVSAQSGEAALHAAGAAIAAVDVLIKGDGEHVFCAVRPPGHHAEPGRSMGFCLFNNIAVAALYARDKYGIDRIGVVDFDVHHGNGTQAAFEQDANLFYASTHETPLYPGTGARHESGIDGNIVNEPLEPGADGKDFRKAFENRILPELDRFRPQLLLVSSG